MNQTPGTLLVERILLGALTALIVARPLVAGDDPGRLRLISGAGPLILNALTFVLFIAWAAFFVWKRRPFVRGPGMWVVLGLVVVAILTFISAAQPDRYARPGWFIGWDWLAIATTCFLAWQLASTPLIARGFAAVLIATAVCLGAQALYQKAADSFGWPTTEHLAPALSIPLVGDDEFGLKLDQAAPPAGNFRATFNQPDTLICFLILGGMVLSLWIQAIAMRQRQKRWQNLFLLLIWIVVGWIMLGSGHWSNQGIASPPLYELIRQFPLLGGGPGNLSRLTATGGAQAGNYWLGLAATMGVLAAVILVSLIVAYVVADSRFRRAHSEQVEPIIKTRWEFFVGGIAGLLLGMVLAISDIPPECPPSEIVRLGIVGAGRMLVWMIAFALLERLRLPARECALPLFGGVMVVAIVGIGSDAISSAPLLVCFWLAMVLSVAGVDHQQGAPPARPIAFIAVSLGIALLAANLLHVGVPGWKTSAAARSARQASMEFLFEGQITSKYGQERLNAIAGARDYLHQTMLGPLESAAKYDPQNSALLLEIARWKRWSWHYSTMLSDRAFALMQARQMLEIGPKVAALDPRNPAAQLSEFETRLRFARGNLASSVVQQVVGLDKTIAAIVEKQPAREVALRYRVVAEVLHEGRDQRTLESWTLQLLRLDDAEGSPHGQLDRDQRMHLLERARRLLDEPSPEMEAYFQELPK